MHSGHLYSSLLLLTSVQQYYTLVHACFGVLSVLLHVTLFFALLFCMHVLVLSTLLKNKVVMSGMYCTM